MYFKKFLCILSLLLFVACGDSADSVGQADIDDDGVSSSSQKDIESSSSNNKNASSSSKVIASSSSAETKTFSSSSKKETSSSSVASKLSSSSRVKYEVVPIKDKSFSGVAQKGPFAAGYTITICELDGYYDLNPKSCVDVTQEAEWNQGYGTYNVSDLSLSSQYASFEAKGYFYNETNGKRSNDSITLNCLADLSNRDKVNINLLTHLEYKRVLYLVKTGISFSDAKKQAEADVLNALAGVKREINDFQNIGTGDKTEARIVDVEDLLGLKTGTIARIKARNNSQKELNKVCEYYDKAVKDQLDIKKIQHEAKVSAALDDFQKRTKNIRPICRDIETTLQQLDDPQYDKEAVLKNARIIIGRSYAELESQFNGLYTYDENIYHSDRLVKVTKVWGDYMRGKFKNTDYTLWYWILLSIIVDIAAFAFFDIAFKKEEV